MRYLLGREYWTMSAAERAEIWAWCDTVLRPALDGLASVGPMLRALGGRRG